MKIRNILLVITAALCVVSCSKEDNLPTVAEIAGNYDGYTLANSTYFQNKCTDKETIAITENTDGSAKVLFKSTTWGDFMIDKAQISKTGDFYTLTGKGKASMGRGDKKSSYDCELSAKISSKTNAQIQFKIPAVMGGLTIDFMVGKAPVELLLAGSYKGYTNAGCKYFQNKYTENETVQVTANKNKTLTVTFESKVWGSFKAPTVTITQKGEEYTFTGKGTVAMGMSDKKNDYDFTVTGTKNIAKDTYVIVFHVPAVMGGLTITLNPGTAPSATN